MEVKPSSNLPQDHRVNHCNQIVTHRFLTAVSSHAAGRWFVIFAALLVVSASVACSNATPSATPTATALPSPVPTDLPTAEPAAQNELAAASEKIFSLVEELVAELGHREGGTAEELQAAQNIRERFEEMGYSARIQSFTAQRFDLEHWTRSRGENAMVVVESPTEMRIPGLLLTIAPPKGVDSGPLTPVNLDGLGELQKDELKGRVALIKHGIIQLDDIQTLQALQDQVNDVAQAGAIAAVISGRFAGLQSYRPLLEAESSIPALLVSKDFGGSPTDLLTEGEVILSVKIDTIELESRNVVAELKGESEDVVIVGAHYDVVPQTTAGANDNTSGIAVLLALANAFSGRPMPFTLRFIAFGAEELGLYGSRYYVTTLADAELHRVAAMLNLDTVGTGARMVASANDELTALALESANEMEVEVHLGSPPRGAFSDHTSFENAGVPVLIFFASDYSRIHTPNDRLEFVHPVALGGTFLAARALLQSPEFAQWASQISSAISTASPG